MGIRQHGIGLRVPALHLIAAKRVDRLRRQANMRHHRNATFHEKADGLGHLNTPLQLHRARAGFRHQPGGIAKRLLRTFLVAGKGHVDHHHRLFQSARYGLTVQDHHLHRDAKRRGQTVQHHPDAVANQHKIAMTVHELRHRCGIGGQAHQRGAAFAGANILGIGCHFAGRCTHDAVLSVRIAHR